jgi:hypothetical protein
MTFRLFDSETKGAELWAETHPVVEVSNGLFQVLLGSITPFPVNLFDGNTLWLQTEVGAEVLSPRKPLVSTAYSQRSGDADHAATAEWATDAQHATYADTADYSISGGGWTVDGDNVYRMTGKVGIGTSNPLTELDVSGSVNATTYYGDGSNLTGVSGISDGDWTISGSDLYSSVGGNVGIGTMTPNYKLDVNGDASVEGLWLPGAFGPDTNYVGEDGNWIAFGHPGASEDFLGYKSNTFYFKDSPAGADVTDADVIIGGKVGIGTESPGAKLHVVGDTDNYGTMGGSNYGTYGVSLANTGVFGVSGTAVGGENPAGVVGSSSSNPGVVGYSTNNAAVMGYSASVYAAAVAGINSGNGPGVYGNCSGLSACVYGVRADSGIAVQGTSYDGYGIYGLSSSEEGMGVVGVQTTYSWSDISGFGNYRPGGLFGGRNGVIGFTKEHNGYGVMGRSLNSNTQSWAGRFLSAGSGVYIYAPAGHTGLTVASGTKNAVMPTDDGSRLLYCEESTEVWFSDHGFGRLQNGSTVIDIDPLFAQTVSLDEPYHVFIQVYGDADVYVTGRTADHFEVHLREGNPNVEFSYRVMAKRIGYEQTRLEHAAWADNDPNLYPEKQFNQSQID